VFFGPAAAGHQARTARTAPDQEVDPVKRVEEEKYEVGDEVIGRFRCAACDLLIVSPRENDGVLVLPICPLCHGEEWRRVG
jgi:hypothetical protein